MTRLLLALATFFAVVAFSQTMPQPEIYIPINVYYQGGSFIGLRQAAPAYTDRMQCAHDLAEAVAGAAGNAREGEQMIGACIAIPAVVTAN